MKKYYTMLNSVTVDEENKVKSKKIRTEIIKDEENFDTIAFGLPNGIIVSIILKDLQDFIKLANNGGSNGKF